MDLCESSWITVDFWGSQWIPVNLPGSLWITVERGRLCQWGHSLTLKDTAFCWTRDRHVKRWTETREKQSFLFMDHCIYRKLCSVHINCDRIIHTELKWWTIEQLFFSGALLMTNHQMHLGRPCGSYNLSICATNYQKNPSFSKKAQEAQKAQFKVKLHQPAGFLQNLPVKGLTVPLLVTMRKQ